MLIDFHFHAFPDELAPRAIGSLEDNCHETALTDGTVSQALARFDEWGVDSAVLLPIATKPAQQQKINNWAAGLDGGRIISFGTVHPDSDVLFEEMHRAVSIGLHGFKLHPDYQGFFIDEKRLDPMFDEFERIGLPVTVHAGYDPYSPERIHCLPEAAASMIKRHKHLKLILAHLGGNEHWQESLDHICGTDGEIYLDTAYSLHIPDSLLLKMIRKHGADRVLFASDCPWASSAATKQKICSLPLTDDEKDLIFFGNACRLLKN
ncbi:MAG: amidohydrolase family protein [Ruminococcus sp.]|nr:amidohydrolase family protein [Ruminococcus sp.]